MFLHAQVAFNLTQPELEALGSCLLSGGYFGLIPGFLYDALRHRHKLGPRCASAPPSLSIILPLWHAFNIHDRKLSWMCCGCRLIAALGCLVHFTGYFAVWLAAKGIVPLPFPVLLGFALLGSSAVVFFDSATIVTCMRNFPNERGNSAGARTGCPWAHKGRSPSCMHACLFPARASSASSGSRHHVQRL